MTSNYPRIALWAALAIALWLNYEAWVRDYGSLPLSSAEVASHGPGGAGQSGPNLTLNVPRVAAGAAQSSASASAPAAPVAALPGGAAAAAAPVISVRTDVLDVEISLSGGTLVKANLSEYPEVKGQPATVELENRASPDTFYILETGLTGSDAADRPTHLARFSSPQNSYTLAPGRDELSVPLTWTDGHGVTVTKTFTFRRGSYAIGLEQSVDNRTGMPWTAAAYAAIVRYDRPTKRSYFNVESYAFHGPAIYDGTKYRKLNIRSADDDHLSLEVTGGWLAAPQHNFVSAVIPPPAAGYRYTMSVVGNEYDLGTLGPMRSVAPDSTAHFDLTLFVGPKLQAQLETTAHELDLVADYGHLTLLAKPLFWLLEKVHGLLHNWGLAIIVVTFLLKLLFYPLSEASGRSMAKMKALAPRIKTIQETYKDDREKAGRAMMELYQREKINPVAGCLPIVIQIPVFLAFYWVLLESVEMRQAPFLGWIQDLTARDPYFILPGIMAVAMLVQYKLNPAPPDPMQAKIMMIMPVAMSVMFAFFPAGLVLYYVTNTILSIAQQWNINRRIEEATKKQRS
ncbi:MAG TPA: membrane protein insertase YidC [Steroidobacteraceae bacterium]|nr:membrane protein insertase YidC [Steroidobacteraceae bacterium]